MERLPLSQTSQFPNYYPMLGSPTVQSPRAGLAAGHFIPGLPSPPALHHTVSKHRLGSASSMHTPPPYDTNGLFSAAAAGCHPALLYSPTALHGPSSIMSPSPLDRRSPTVAESGVLANLVTGQVTSTVGSGSSTEGCTADVTSPRETSTSAQGMLLCVCVYWDMLMWAGTCFDPCTNIHSTLIVV